jgi:hypothetical protein
MTYDPRELPPTRRFDVPIQAPPAYPPGAPPAYPSSAPPAYPSSALPLPPSAPPMSPPSPYGYGAPYAYAPSPVPQVIVAQVLPTSGVATASMVLGILGALGGWCMLGIPCAVAILLGHLGLSATRDGARGGRGMAVAGLVLGYVFVVPWAILFFTAFAGTIAGTDPSSTATP